MAKSTQLYDEFGGKLYPFSLTSLVLDDSGKLLESRLKALEQLLDWFELDEESNLIKANHGMYSVGPFTAGGKATDQEFPNAVNRLEKLRDVLLANLQDGDALVYDADKGIWINGKVEGGGGSGADAVLQDDITADVSVGFVTKGKILTKGMTLTQVLQQIFSQAVTSSKPTVTLAGSPTSAIEVGETVTLHLSSTYYDGKFKNTKDGTIDAGCEKLITAYSLDGSVISIPHSFEALTPDVHTVQVSQQYGASTAEVKSVAGEVLDISIPAGTATASSSFMVGYRAFWGYLTDAEANSLTSDLVRGLEHSGTIINPTASSITLLNADDTVPAGEDLIITAPEGYKLGEVINKDDISFAEGFSKTSLTVKCAGTSTKKYNIYRYDNQSDYPMDIKKITIIKE